MTLRELRKLARISVAEVANVLSVEAQTVYRYEQGTRKIQIDQVMKLAKLYDCPAEEIISAQLNSCQSYQANSRH